LKCGAGEGWRRSVENVCVCVCVKNEEVLHRVQVERNILHTVKGRKEGRLSGLVTSYIGTAF